MDAPHHKKTRGAITRMFHTAALDFESQLPVLAEKYASLAEQKTRGDIVQDLTEPYALECMCRLFGFPTADHPKLKTFTERFFYLFAPITDADMFREINLSISHFRSYIVEQLQAQKKSGECAFLVAKQALDDQAKYSISDEEVADNILLLYADGVENIKYGIAHALYLIGANRKDTWALTEDVQLRRAIAETLRLESPAQIIPRIVKQKFELHGTVLKENAAVFLALGSANKDEEVFERPNTFDIDREQGKVLSFGVGQHSCVGRLFASKQIFHMVRALINVQDFRVEPKGGNMDFVPRLGHRWPSNLLFSC